MHSESQLPMLHGSALKVCDGGWVFCDSFNQLQGEMFYEGKGGGVFILQIDFDGLVSC